MKTPRKVLAIAGLVAVAAFGMLLRATHLSHPPLNIDEAESAINALTILQHGYPSDRYLGLPLFENTLIRPWPDHPEYEFRDTSYSDRGMAIYHGWLPLYAIAGTFACAGVMPDEPSHPPRVLHDAADMQVRTVAARLPSVLFGAAFIAAAYFAARDMFGPSAAAVALVVASLAEPCVRVARVARYYSATLAVATLCCWAVWGIYRRGRWREFLLGAAALAAAFHTHALTFAVACAALAVTANWWLRRPGAWARAGALAAIVAVAVVPWALVTGFPGPSTHIPPARSLMVLPEDLVSYLREHLPLVVLVIGAALVALLMAPRAAGALPARLTAPFTSHRAPIMLTLAWLIIGAAMFLLTVPAPSAFFWRMTLPLQGAAILLASALAAGVATVVLPRRAGWAAVVVCGAFLARPGALFANFRSPPPPQREPLYDAIAHLHLRQIAPDTKLYAVPFQHFPLAFYSGLPVQSIAPVRKSFLDGYGGDVILIDPAPRRASVPRQLISAAAADSGSPISEEEARAWERRLWSRILREDLARRVARVEPDLEPLPDFVAEAVRRARQLPPRRDGLGRWQNPAIFRGFECDHRADFWPMFFYRFVDPRSRSGEHLNYARRMRNATATVLPQGWVIYHSPGATAPVASDEGLRQVEVRR